MILSPYPDLNLYESIQPCWGGCYRFLMLVLCFYLNVLLPHSVSDTVTQHRTASPLSLFCSRLFHKFAISCRNNRMYRRVSKGQNGPSWCHHVAQLCVRCTDGEDKTSDCYKDLTLETSSINVK